MEEIDITKPWGIWDLANRLRGTFDSKEAAQTFFDAHKGDSIGWAIDEMKHYTQEST